MPVTITGTEIADVLEIQTGSFSDDRGSFAETYSRPVWQAQGFAEQFVQDNVSVSKGGNLRGMHYQLLPHGMGKLVRVLQGEIFDVGIDLRKDSETFGKWVGRTLNAENRLALYFPPGFAHGFVALRDDTIVYYKCTSAHCPEAERAVSYQDPEVGIAWPMTPRIISAKDAAAPRLAEAEHNF